MFIKNFFITLVKFLTFLKITIFDFHERLNNSTTTKYKLHEICIHKSEYVVCYSVKYNRLILRTNLIEIFKNENLIKSFSKKDMLKIFYFYSKNYILSNQEK